MPNSPRVPFIFETSRDSDGDQPIASAVENPLIGGDALNAFKYMKIVGNPLPGAGTLDVSDGDTVTFSIENLPVGATVAWAQVTGTGATDNAFTLPTDKTTASIVGTAAAATSAGNLAYVDVTVTFNGVAGTTANGGKIRSEGYTVQS